MTSEPFAKTWRRRCVSLATNVQTGSAMTLGSVLVVHLAAPVVAGIVGPSRVDWANQTMLLGRIYYQNRLLEPIVVWGALCAHVTASAVRKALLPSAKPKSISQWSWAQWHSAAGWLLLPVLLTHVLTNRLIPSISSSPIESLSPSELDMSYVTYGFQNPHFTARSIVLYGTLILATAMHWVGGFPKMKQRLSKKHASPRLAITLAGGLVIVLTMGTFTIAQSSIQGIGPMMLARVRIAY